MEDIAYEAVNAPLLPPSATSTTSTTSDNAAGNKSSTLLNPTWINYGRVVVDVIMAVLLVFAIIGEIDNSQTLNRKSIHVHQIPVYLKSTVDFSSMWTKAQLVTGSNATKLDAFKKAVSDQCIDIQGHPMCVCINVAVDEIVTKNCLLQHPVPSVNSDWNIGAVSSSLILWFLASLATSIGTLPFVTNYITMNGSEVEDPGKSTSVMLYNKVMCCVYVAIVLLAVIAPIITTAIQFPGSGKHMDSILCILCWGLVVLVSMGAYNYETVAGYFTYNLIQGDTKDAAIAEANSTRLHMSVNNWMLYVHLLISAPAIAMVLHLTQQWTEYNTIVNTTLVLSTIFAVDAFSVEMANFWVHRTAIPHPVVGNIQVSPDEKQKRMMDMHTRLGLIRMLAWIVNAVMLLLLFTLAYPVEVEAQQTNSAVYVVVVVAFAGVFLAPDLVREFTDRVSFNSIQFRLYGDFVIRALVLFFVWRTSVVEHS
jgi:hypothetical protein